MFTPPHFLFTHACCPLQVTFLRDSSRQSTYQTLAVNSTYLTTTHATPVATAAVKTGGTTSLANGATITSVTSTKVAKECSGRGTCNAGGVNTGMCSCYGGYASSNGRSLKADVDWNIRDCGFERGDYNWTMGGFADITCPIVAPQWGGSAAQCGGVGTCANKVCT